MPDGTVEQHSRQDAAAVSSHDDPTRPPADARPSADLPGQRSAETRPPVNLRLTVPIFGKRFYFALVGGKERRGHERIALERRRNPIGTKTNLAFIFVGAMVLYMLTLGMFLVYAAVLEV